jgi:hypothetical protein
VAVCTLRAGNRYPEISTQTPRRACSRHRRPTLPRYTDIIVLFVAWRVYSTPTWFRKTNLFTAVTASVFTSDTVWSSIPTIAFIQIFQLIVFTRMDCQGHLSVMHTRNSVTSRYRTHYVYVLACHHTFQTISLHRSNDCSIHNNLTSMWFIFTL